MKSNKFWIIIICGLLVLSIAAVFALAGSKTQRAYIYQDGSLITEIDLSVLATSETLLIGSYSGYNIIKIEQGRIRVSDADCPDKLCVRQGWSTGGAFPIICLPNRFVISFDTGGQFHNADIDAITG